MPDDQILTAVSPTEDLNRFSNLVNTAINDISNQVAQAFDQSISQALPDVVRRQWITTAAEQFAQYYLQQNLSNQQTDSPLTQQEVIRQAVDALEDTNHPLSSFIPPKARQYISTVLQDKLDGKSVEDASEAYLKAKQFRLKRPPTDSQVTAQTLLQNIPDDKKYGVDQTKTVDILHHLRNQKDIINNPTKKQVERAINSLTDQSETLDLTPEVANKFSQQLLEQTDTIHHYILSATDPLPQETAFTPFKPRLDPNTIRQAGALGVSPLSLAYTKAGFDSNDPKLSKDLQTEISQLQKIISDPFNPQNKLTLNGYLTAAKLKPKVFVAQNYYHPIYNSYQKLLAKTNNKLDKPLQFFLSTQKQYQGFKNAYREFTQKNPLGWLITPRQRARLTADRVKIGFQRRLRYQILKTSKGRNQYRRYKKITKTYNDWKPSGIRRRVSGWFRKQSIKLTMKAGDWLIEKGIKGLGGILVKVSTLATESASIIALPLAALQITFGLAKLPFNKLKKQIQEERAKHDQAGIAAKFIQSLITGLKALGAFIFGSLGGLLGSIAGAIAGFLIGSAIGTPLLGVFTAIAGFFGGGALGTALGALVGFNWATIAAIPGTIAASATGFFSSLTGTSVAPVAGTIAAVGLVAGGTVAALSSSEAQLISTAFFLPDFGTGSYETMPSVPSVSDVDCSDEKQPLPGSPPGSPPIARRAWEIVSDLYQGFWCYWNRSPGDFSTDVVNYPPSYPELFDEVKYKADPFPTEYGGINLFWCTYLVFKSFNETGHPLPGVIEEGGSKKYLINSQYMQDYFSDPDSPYNFIPNQANVYKKVQPGDVIFIENKAYVPGRTNHVGIVHKVVGKDYLTTVESNAASKTTQYTIDEDGSIQPILGTLFVKGFGQL